MPPFSLLQNRQHIHLKTALFLIPETSLKRDTETDLLPSNSILLSLYLAVK